MTKSGNFLEISSPRRREGSFVEPHFPPRLLSYLSARFESLHQHHRQRTSSSLVQWTRRWKALRHS